MNLFDDLNQVIGTFANTGEDSGTFFSATGHAVAHLQESEVGQTLSNEFGHVLMRTQEIGNGVTQVFNDHNQIIGTQQDFAGGRAFFNAMGQRTGMFDPMTQSVTNSFGQLKMKLG